METSSTNESQTAFHSPIPIILRLRTVIFGDKIPDKYTQFTFYLNLFFWFTFFIWSFASYMTISSRELIMKEKNIPVEEVIENRAQALGFEGADFLDRLLTIHSIGIITWSIVFVGLALLYRKREIFIYFIVSGTLFYTGMLVFYLSYSYFKEDITLFDKIGLLAILLSSTMYYFLLKKENSGGSINFFEEEESIE
jgi:hypothetical protein